jgi:hypothetical protein
MLKNVLRTVIAGVSICVLCFTMQCNPDDDDHGGNTPDIEDPLEPKPAVTTNVSGVIIDENGKPVADAEVSVHGETTLTGPDGTFRFDDIQVPGNRCIIQSRKDGYFSGTRALTPDENGQTETRIVLMGSPVTHTFEAGTGSNAALTDGSEVRIPANGLVDDSGNSYSGPVQMSVRYLDPTAGNFGVLVPGGDMLARREDESTSMLYSYGILRVQMTDLSGGNLQLASGSTSTIVMNIPSEQLASAPATIPLWYFDEERGVWQEEGSATREGNQYVGTVSHFTDWNCDDPKEGATIIGRVVDCDGKPAWGVVEFGQVTSDPQSSTLSDESSGRFERRVPDGVQITVIINDPLMITPLTKNERGKVIVIVPPLAPGQVYDVGDIQTFPCASNVKATFNLTEGDKVEWVSFETDNGFQSVYPTSENFETNLPPDTEVTMSIYTSNGTVVGKRFKSVGERETLDLGVIDLTQSANVGEAQIKGITVCYGEIETEGQISVSWLDEDNSGGINYSSPEADGSWTIVAPLNTNVEISSSTEHGTWKRTVTTPSSADQVLDLGTIELCDNPSVGETSFRMTGDGMDNELFNVVSSENNQYANMGVYYKGSNVTIGVVDDLDSETYLTLIFPGNSTGEFDASEEAVVTIQREVGNTTSYYWSAYGMENSTLNLKITKYEAVGGAIEGTFSGTFLVQDDDGFTGETVTVSDGKFSLLRYPDAP